MWLITDARKNVMQNKNRIIRNSGEKELLQSWLPWSRWLKKFRILRTSSALGKWTRILICTPELQSGICLYLRCRTEGARGEGLRSRSYSSRHLKSVIAEEGRDKKEFQLGSGFKCLNWTWGSIREVGLLLRPLTCRVEWTLIIYRIPNETDMKKRMGGRNRR